MVSCEYGRWVEASGIRLHGIAAAFVAHGWRGVVATAHIAAGDTLLEVPAAMLLSRRSAEAEPALMAVLQTQPGLTSEQVLGVHLLHEVSKSQQHSDGIGSNGAGSAWSVYLKELPRSYNTFCNWSESDIEALQVQHAREAAEAAVEDAKRQWHGALPALKALGMPRKFLGFAAWLWAKSTLMSRTMYVPFDTAGCLTPFGDLHNYMPPAPPFTPDVLKGLADERSVNIATGAPTSSPGTRCALPSELPGEQVEDKVCYAGGAAAEDSLLRAERHPRSVATHETALQDQACMATPLHGSIDQQNVDVELALERLDCENDGGDGHFDEACGVYRLVARRGYVPGDQVLLCYGRHSNLELLEHYGFMLDDNPHETALLPLHLLLNRVSQAGRAPAEGGSLQALLQQQDCFVHVNGRPSWRLLLALRTMASSPAERKRCGHQLAAGERVSIAGDLRAMAWLQSCCLLHYNSMPTTAKDDEGLLLQLHANEDCSDVQQPASPNFSLAVQWRLCQKRSLIQAMRECERCITFLAQHMPSDQVENILDLCLRNFGFSE